jgi:hypothetical protein
MKRGTKAIVFFASMALTVGSLLAIVGPRHHRYFMSHGHCWQNENYERKDCGEHNKTSDNESSLKEQSAN